MAIRAEVTKMAQYPKVGGPRAGLQHAGLCYADFMTKWSKRVESGRAGAFVYGYFYRLHTEGHSRP